MDVENFLNARAKELVAAGMVIIIMPACQNGMPYSSLPAGVMFDVMASSLMEMVEEISDQQAITIKATFGIIRLNGTKFFSISLETEIAHILVKILFLRSNSIHSVILFKIVKIRVG